MKIRKATIKDVDTLEEIDFLSEHPMDVQRKLSKAKMKNYITKRLNEGKEEFYICEKYGYITLKRDFPGHKHCEIYWIAVKKQEQGKGIGGKMVTFIEKYARKLGFRKVCVYTGKVMKEAQNFYRKFGYKKVNEFPDYYGFPGTKEEKTAVLLCKRLK